MRILHDDLKLFAYKIQIFQRQTDYNKVERETFCEDISERIKNNPGLLDLIFCVVCHQTKWHHRPYFIEDKNENRVTVDTDRYIELMWTKFIPALMKKRGVDVNTVIYQQNGASLHSSDRSLEFLCWLFPGDRLISRRTNFPWPPYTPDLTPRDYFL